MSQPQIIPRARGYLVPGLYGRGPIPLADAPDAATVRDYVGLVDGIATHGLVGLKKATNFDPKQDSRERYDVLVDVSNPDKDIKLAYLISHFKILNADPSSMDVQECYFVYEPESTTWIYVNPRTSWGRIVTVTQVDRSSLADHQYLSLTDKEHIDESIEKYLRNI